VLTLLGYLLLAVLLVGGLFYLGATLLPAGEQLAPPVRDEPSWAFQHGRAMTAEDVATVRLPVALRGYRFAETDELLDRLAEEIRWRDAELEQLRSGRWHPTAADPADGVEPAALRPPSAAEPAALRPPSAVEPAAFRPPPAAGSAAE
jgi:DivIVA domain-containing protein